MSDFPFVRYFTPDEVEVIRQEMAAMSRLATETAKGRYKVNPRIAEADLK